MITIRQPERSDVIDHISFIFIYMFNQVSIVKYCDKVFSIPVSMYIESSI